LYFHLASESVSTQVLQLQPGILQASCLTLVVPTLPKRLGDLGMMVTCRDYTFQIFVRKSKLIQHDSSWRVRLDLLAHLVAEARAALLPLHLGKAVLAMMLPLRVMIGARSGMLHRMSCFPYEDHLPRRASQVNRAGWSVWRRPESLFRYMARRSVLKP
jgi:hypothetical protein